MTHVPEGHAGRAVYGLDRFDYRPGDVVLHPVTERPFFRVIGTTSKRIVKTGKPTRAQVVIEMEEITEGSQCASRG
jgi:hypothetical protein